MGPMAPTDDGTDHDSAQGRGSDRPGEPPVGALRGAGVQVDTARAGRVAVALVLVALVVVGLGFLVGGYRRNAQIDQLRSQGVPVQVTVSHCLGLMGGTGSSPAGYECIGTYTFRGTHYVEGVPGSTFYPDRTVIAGVVASGDPGLLSTPASVASSHASATLYIVSGALLGAAAVIVTWLVVRRRRTPTTR